MNKPCFQRILMYKCNDVWNIDNGNAFRSSSFPHRSPKTHRFFRKSQWTLSIVAIVRFLDAIRIALRQNGYFSASESENLSWKKFYLFRIAFRKVLEPEISVVWEGMEFLRTELPATKYCNIYPKNNKNHVCQVIFVIIACMVWH